MILVTVGTLPFTRLTSKMDEVAALIEEKVVMQIAGDPIIPDHAEYFRFRSYPDMQAFCQEARLVVCHAGVGSIVTALQAGAKVVAVPRRKEFGEALDNHQEELANLLAQEGRIILVEDVEDLAQIIVTKTFHRKVVQLDNKLIMFLKDYVANMNIQAKGKLDG